MATQTFLATTTITSVENFTITSTILPESTTAFVGWSIDSGSVVASYLCPGGQSFSGAPKGAACCIHTSGSACTNVYTTCSGNVALGAAGTTVCSSSYPDCSTLSIFNQYPTDSSSPTPWIDCFNIINGVSSYYLTVFEKIVTNATATMTSTITSYSTLPSSAVASTTSLSASLTSSALQTSTSNSGTPSQSSNAWIAGAVVGPVAGVALIALGVYLFFFRNSRGRSQPVPTDSPHMRSLEMAPKRPADSYMDDPIYLSPEIPPAELESPHH